MKTKLTRLWLPLLLAGIFFFCVTPLQAGVTYTVASPLHFSSTTVTDSEHGDYTKYTLTSTISGGGNLTITVDRRWIGGMNESKMGYDVDIHLSNLPVTDAVVHTSVTATGPYDTNSGYIHAYLTLKPSACSQQGREEGRPFSIGYGYTYNEGGAIYPTAGISGGATTTTSLARSWTESNAQIDHNNAWPTLSCSRTTINGSSYYQLIFDPDMYHNELVLNIPVGTTYTSTTCRLIHCIPTSQQDVVFLTLTPDEYGIQQSICLPLHIDPSKKGYLPDGRYELSCNAATRVNSIFVSSATCANTQIEGNRSVTDPVFIEGHLDVITNTSARTKTITFSGVTIKGDSYNYRYTYTSPAPVVHAFNVSTYPPDFTDYYTTTKRSVNLTEDGSYEEIPHSTTEFHFDSGYGVPSFEAWFINPTKQPTASSGYGLPKGRYYFGTGENQFFIMANPNSNGEEPSYGWFPFFVDGVIEVFDEEAHNTNDYNGIRFSLKDEFGHIWRYNWYDYGDNTDFEELHALYDSSKPNVPIWGWSDRYIWSHYYWTFVDYRGDYHHVYDSISFPNFITMDLDAVRGSTPIENCRLSLSYLDKNANALSVSNLHTVPLDLASATRNDNKEHLILSKDLNVELHAWHPLSPVNREHPYLFASTYLLGGDGPYHSSYYDTIQTNYWSDSYSSTYDRETDKWIYHRVAIEDSLTTHDIWLSSYYDWTEGSTYNIPVPDTILDWESQHGQVGRDIVLTLTDQNGTLLGNTIVEVPLINTRARNGYTTSVGSINGRKTFPDASVDCSNWNLFNPDDAVVPIENRTFKNIIDIQRLQSSQYNGSGSRVGSSNTCQTAIIFDLRPYGTLQSYVPSFPTVTDKVVMLRQVGTTAFLPVGQPVDYRIGDIKNFHTFQNGLTTLERDLNEGKDLLSIANYPRYLHGRDFLVKYYDGEKRTTNGGLSANLQRDTTNWVRAKATDTIPAGKGSVMAFHRSASDKTPLQRHFMGYVFNAADLKKAKKTPIYDYGIEKYMRGEITPNNVGWNFVSIPYFYWEAPNTGSSSAWQSEDSPEANLLCGNLATGYDTYELFDTIPYSTLFYPSYNSNYSNLSDGAYASGRNSSGKTGNLYSQYGFPSFYATPFIPGTDDFDYDKREYSTVTTNGYAEKHYYVFDYSDGTTGHSSNTSYTNLYSFYEAFFIQAGDERIGHQDSLYLVWKKPNQSIAARRAPASTGEQEQAVVLGFLPDTALTSIPQDGIVETTTLRIHNRFTDQYEFQADLAKRMEPGPYPYLYTISGSNLLAFNALPESSAQGSVPVGFYAPFSGSYTIALPDSISLPRIQAVFLTDHELNITTNLMLSPYTFTTPAMQNNTRFVVSCLIAPAQTPTSTTTSQNGQAYASLSGQTLRIFGLQAGERVTLYGATGQLVYDGTATSDFMQLYAPAPAYIIRLQNDDQVQTLRVVR